MCTMDVYRDPDAIGNVLKLPGSTTRVDIYSVQDIIQILETVEAPILRMLLITTPTAPEIQFWLSTSQTVP